MRIASDIESMMISHEQARAAALHLRSYDGSEPGTDRPNVSPEVLAAAVAVARSTPDTNPQRLAEARHYLDGDGTDSRAVASMMIQRIISDSLR